MQLHSVNLRDCALGVSSEHIDFSSFEKPVHKALVPHLTSLKEAAAENGFDLQLASGFRDSARQLFIWNGKVDGRRSLLSATGEQLDSAELSDSQLVYAILRWSALPGASRHHWGTDFDFYDGSRISASELQLVPGEYEPGGPCSELLSWLREQEVSGFFWPYAADSGGVAPEPWHLSYKPLALGFQAEICPEVLRKFICGVDLSLKGQVLSDLELIFEKYIDIGE